jgi:hypothetical protein
MTTYRELLERLVVFADKKVDGLKVTNYQIYTPAGQQLIEEVRAFLAQPMTKCEESLAKAEAYDTLAELHESIASQLEAAGYVTPTPVAVEQLLSREGELVAALERLDELKSDWKLGDDVQMVCALEMEEILAPVLRALAQGKKE